MEKSQQKKLLRVLCFHGFGTNKSILDYQLRQFKKFFKNVEFISINGPIEVNSTFVTMNDPALSPLLEKYEKKCYSWFRALHEKPYVYMDQIMKYIIEVIKKEGPFDGILGFSQGGAVATYFAYYLEFFKEKIKDWAPPKFAILICSGGFFPPQPKKKFTIEIPSIHFIGENDFLFAKPLFTSTLFQKPIVIFHKEGHKIPKLTEHEINIMKEFFKKFDGTKNIIKAKL